MSASAAVALALLWGCRSGGGGASSAAGAGGAEAGAAHGAPAGRTEGAAPNAMVSATELRERAIEALLTLTAHEHPQIRANAIEGLGAAPARLEAVLPAALMDDNAGVRSVAAISAGRDRRAALVPLVRPLLEDPSPYVRASAIYALRRCGAGVDPTPLGTMLLRDDSPRVRAHAAFLLGELGDASALGMLREAAVAPMERAGAAEVRLMRLQIAEAMVKLGEESQVEVVRAALYPSRPEELEGTALAVQIIGQVRDKGAIDNLIYLAEARDEAGQRMPAEVRLGIAASLAKLGLPQGSYIAMEYVGDANAVIRAQAAWVLGYTARPGDVAWLERLLDDPSEQVRVAAATSVLRVGESASARAGE